MYIKNWHDYTLDKQISLKTAYFSVLYFNMLGFGYVHIFLWTLSLF